MGAPAATRTVSLRERPSLGEPQRTESIPRIVRLLALAHRWHRLIETGEIRDQAAIARATGLTRARVTQIMDLRWISPAIQTSLVQSQRGPNQELRFTLNGRADHTRWASAWDDTRRP